jgi:hypothetical protein
LQKYGIYTEKNYIVAMKNKLKRTVLLILLGIILFSASMAFPVIYNSKFKDLAQGGAVGLMIAGFITAIKTLIDERKATK